MKTVILSRFIRSHQVKTAIPSKPIRGYSTIQLTSSACVVEVVTWSPLRINHHSSWELIGPPTKAIIPFRIIPNSCPGALLAQEVYAVAVNITIPKAELITSNTIIPTFGNATETIARPLMSDIFHALWPPSVNIFLPCWPQSMNINSWIDNLLFAHVRTSVKLLDLKSANITVHVRFTNLRRLLYLYCIIMESSYPPSRILQKREITGFVSPENSFYFRHHTSSEIQ